MYLRNIIAGESTDSDQFTGPLGLWRFPVVNSLRSIRSNGKSENTPDLSANVDSDDIRKIDEEDVKTSNEDTEESNDSTVVGYNQNDNIGSSDSDSFELLSSGPVLPKQKIDNPFQTDTVPNDGTEVDVLRIDIERGKAAVIKQIANEWYSGMDFELIVDDVKVKKNIERQIAPLDDPEEVEILVKDSIIWRSSNRGSEDRTVSALADGAYIPEEVYDKRIKEYKEKMMG